MSVAKKINRKNLSALCHTAGFRGVSGLCRSLGISRNTAYEAVTMPERYPVAFPKILKALNAQN
jgi:hypothetical protein